MSDIAPGLSHELRHVVSEDLRASHLGSGQVGVLSTPSMIMLMEAASMACVQPRLPEGSTTVGYVVNIRHLGPSAIGSEVVVRSTVEEFDGRKVRFKVECRDGNRLVGSGEHVRAVIDTSSFLEKTMAGGR